MARFAGVPTGVSLPELVDDLQVRARRGDAEANLLFAAVVHALLTCTLTDAEPVQFLVQMGGYDDVTTRIRDWQTSHASARLEAMVSTRLSDYLHAGQTVLFHEWGGWAEQTYCAACASADGVQFYDLDELGLDPRRDWDWTLDAPADGLDATVESIVTETGSQWIDIDGSPTVWSASPARLNHVLLLDEMARRAPTADAPPDRPQPVPVVGEPGDDPSAWVGVGDPARGFMSTVEAGLSGWHRTLSTPIGGAGVMVHCWMFNGLPERPEVVDSPEAGSFERTDAPRLAEELPVAVGVAVTCPETVPTEEEWSRYSFAERLSAVYTFFELNFFAHPEPEQVEEGIAEYIRRDAVFSPLTASICETVDTHMRLYGL